MPLLPIFLKLMGSAAMRGAGSIGAGKAAGIGFAQRYTADFASGVKRGLHRQISGLADGQNFVSYAQAGFKKLFYELPKAIGQRRWGEHMAGALVKVTSERLATMNAALSPYGGSAQTYAQSMTSLADKAFKLGFGEADWLKSVMKYTMGEYDPFGSGPNGMKTKEENLEWFKDRYNGRKDMTDEARTIGGILGLSPDLIKLILDGHRELLEKGNHLTAEQVRASSELEFTRKQTEAKWQEVADIWGAKTAGFWKGWEEFKGRIADFVKNKMKGEKDDSEVAQDYNDRLRGVYQDVTERGLLKEDASDWKGLRYHMTSGEGKTWTDEQLAEFALAQEKAGVGKASTNLAKLLAVRKNNKRGYMIHEGSRYLTEEEIESGEKALISSTAYSTNVKRSSSQWRVKRANELKQEEFENELLNPRWMDGVRYTEKIEGLLENQFRERYDVNRFRKNLDSAPDDVRDYFGRMTEGELVDFITQRRKDAYSASKRKPYDPKLKDKHKAELSAPGYYLGDPENKVNPFLPIPQHDPMPWVKPKTPFIPSNGVVPAQTQAPSGRVVYDQSKNEYKFIVNDPKEAVDIKKGIDQARDERHAAAVDGAPEKRGEYGIQANYIGNVG